MTLEAEGTLSALEIRGLPVDHDQLFSPAVTSENLPELNWERKETQIDLLHQTETVISAGSDRPHIVVRYKTNDPGSVNTETSIRIPKEKASYTLWYKSYGTDKNQTWELIKRIPSNVPDGDKKPEQVAFNEVSTNPTFILDNTVTPEWQKVLENTRILLSSLPDDYPEKKDLITAWGQVKATSGEQRQIAPGNPKWFKEVQGRIDTLLQQQKPNAFQRLLDRITALIKGPNGYGSERSQPIPADLDINRRNSRVIR